MNRDARILVIGGGPAGAACAIRLRQRGAAVDIAEKERFPRSKVCGCCLGGGGLSALQTLELRDRIEQIGSPLHAWQGSLGSHLANLSLPVGVAISRESLDSEMLSTAAAAGANVISPCAATITDADQNGVTVRFHQSGENHTRVYECVIVAAGLNAAGLSRFLPWIEPPSGPFGVSFTASADTPCEQGVIYMACDEDGYVGVVRLENGRIDVAAALASGSVAARRGDPQKRVLETLSRSRFSDWSIGDCSPVMTTPPLRRRRAAGRGRVLAIGDAAGYVEPFTGEGMSWAMQSGIVAADTIVAAENELSMIGDQWQHSQQSLLRSKKFICRTLTTVLRSSLARRAVGRTLASWPGLAAPLVRNLNANVFPVDHEHAHGSRTGV